MNAETSELATIDVGTVKIIPGNDRQVGVKVEILKVGDLIRVYKKVSYAADKTYLGIICDFEPFKDNPTIVMACFETGTFDTEMTILKYPTEGIEIVKASSIELASFDPKDFTKALDKTVDEKSRELEQAKIRRQYYLRYWGKIFTEVRSDKDSE